MIKGIRNCIPFVVVEEDDDRIGSGSVTESNVRLVEGVLLY
jgi:hypothetical protein